MQSFKCYVLLAAAFVLISSETISDSNEPHTALAPTNENTDYAEEVSEKSIAVTDHGGEAEQQFDDEATEDFAERSDAVMIGEIKEEQKNSDIVFDTMKTDETEPHALVTAAIEKDSSEKSGVSMVIEVRPEQAISDAIYDKVKEVEHATDSPATASDEWDVSEKSDVVMLNEDETERTASDAVQDDVAAIRNETDTLPTVVDERDGAEESDVVRIDEIKEEQKINDIVFDAMNTDETDPDALVTAAIESHISLKPPGETEIEYATLIGEIFEKPNDSTVSQFEPEMTSQEGVIEEITSLDVEISSTQTSNSSIPDSNIEEIKPDYDDLGHPEERKIPELQKIADVTNLAHFIASNPICLLTFATLVFAIDG